MRLRLFKYLAPDVAIDLGTANTLIFVEGEGILANEPSFVTYHDRGPESGQIVAFGHKAKELRGRTGQELTSSSPLRGGVIHDFHLAASLLRYFLRKVPGPRRMLRSRVLVGVPSGASSVERRAVVEASEMAGATQVLLVDEALAAAIGVGLPVDEGCATVIVDIGGGSTDVAVISSNRIVYSSSIRTAGNRLDERLTDYVRRKHSVIIGDETAEQVKFAIGAALPCDEDPEIVVQGRNIVTNLPTEVTLTQSDTAKAYQGSLEEILELVRVALEHTPPDLMADVGDRGIFLVGGGALLRDLDSFFSDALGIPVACVGDPLTAVVQGSAKILRQWGKYGHLASGRVM